MKEILNEVLEKIRPDKKEIEKIANISKKLKDKAVRENVEPLIVGSVAKETNLKGADIDLFIKFNKNIDLKQKGLEIARKILPDGKELYAQHPYLRGEIEGIGLDVVPCYIINDSANSISALSVSAIILARSPLIRSIRHTLSISIKYVSETAKAETTSAISIKAPNTAFLVPFQDRHIEC